MVEESDSSLSQLSQSSPTLKSRLIYAEEVWLPNSVLTEGNLWLKTPRNCLEFRHLRSSCVALVDVFSATAASESIVICCVRDKNSGFVRSKPIGQTVLSNLVLSCLALPCLVLSGLALSCCVVLSWWRDVLCWEQNQLFFNFFLVNQGSLLVASFS